MTRIIQISDPHIVPHGQLAYGQVDTAKALADCVETINRSLPEIGPVDMVIVAGDLTDFGTEGRISTVSHTYGATGPAVSREFPATMTMWL